MFGVKNLTNTEKRELTHQKLDEACLYLDKLWGEKDCMITKWIKIMQASLVYEKEATTLNDLLTMLGENIFIRLNTEAWGEGEGS